MHTYTARRRQQLPNQRQCDCTISVCAEKDAFQDDYGFGCDYGFCENIVIWRGHFNATGSETSVNLSINGGQAFAASVFLNQHFIGTAYGKYGYPLFCLCIHGY